VTQVPHGRPALESVAREAIGWLSTGPQVARLETPAMVLVDRPLPEPWFACATRLAFEGDTGAQIDAVRRWFRSRGRDEFFWFVSSETRPRDLNDELVRVGAEPDDELTAMILDHEPAAAPGDVVVRPIETFDDFLAAERIIVESFAFPAEQAAETLASAERAWAHWQTESDRVWYLAWIDDVPVAEAGLAATSAGPMLLSGGATLPAARGRGAYRALIRARWDEAVRRGASELVVQASAMSRPILEHAGFRAVGAVSMFLDRLG
jgi:GNAT superfamily N-acetyltransferase